MESVFVQVTLVPTGTVIGLGLKAFDPRAAAPVTIETLADDPDGLGAGVGVVGKVAGEL